LLLDFKKKEREGIKGSLKNLSLVQAGSADVVKGTERLKKTTTEPAPELVLKWKKAFKDVHLRWSNFE
jgi:hypothetical protein